MKEQRVKRIRHTTDTSDAHLHAVHNSLTVLVATARRRGARWPAGTGWEGARLWHGEETRQALGCQESEGSFVGEWWLDGWRWHTSLNERQAFTIEYQTDA